MGEVWTVVGGGKGGEPVPGWTRGIGGGLEVHVSGGVGARVVEARVQPASRRREARKKCWDFSIESSNSFESTSLHDDN